MIRFALNRLTRMVATLWLLVTLVFFSLQLAPGDPTNTLVSAGANQQVVDALRRDLGLDRPLAVQYVDYLGDMLAGDFGVSWRKGTPVSTQLASAFAHTLALSFTAMVVATVFGVCGGILAAIHRDGFLDVAARTVALMGISIPIFIINLAGIWFLAFKYPIFPTSGAKGWESLVLPAVTLGMFVAAMMLRLVRGATLEILSQDYVRAAFSRGLSRTRVITRHVLPNVLVTIVTLLGIQFGLLLGGSVITESVFAWPGLGDMTIQAIKHKDIPIVQGAVTVFAASFMLVNMLVDVLYPLLDPRLRRGL